MSDPGVRHVAPPQDADRARVDELLTQALWVAVTTPPRRASATPRMSAALAEACRLARASELRPEGLIIRLKAAWERVRDARYPTRDVAQDALDCTVSTCIELYFTERVDVAACPTPDEQ